MTTKIVPIFGLLLFISVALNCYLYFEKFKWKDAWKNQFITTAEVEAMLKKAASDTTIEKFKTIAIAEFGDENVHVVDLQDEFQEYGCDNIALGVNETLLLFKHGVYYGSKANLRNH